MLPSRPAAIAKHWSQSSIPPGKRLRWWQSPTVIRHINRLVCGTPVDGFSQGLIERLRNRHPDVLPLPRAISVGAGEGVKEMALLEQGIVGAFDLYEYSDARISRGRSLAEQKKLSHRITFYNGDAFTSAITPGSYDLVYWNNALHHMPDANAAVAWSHSILATGGIFLMDDYVGASRFQWPDLQMAYATSIRACFENTKYLLDPRRQGSCLPAAVQRPDLDKLVEMDPSEAADSENILSAIIGHFPAAEITPTGGVVYHLVLNDMLDNFDEKSDAHLLNLLLTLDQSIRDLGHIHYAIAIAQKTSTI